MRKSLLKPISLFSFIFSSFFLTGCNYFTSIYPTPQSIEKEISDSNNIEQSEQSSNKKTISETYTYEESNYIPKDELIDKKDIYGTWYIWVPSSATNLYDQQSGEYVTHEYTSGADAGSVELFEDGTYRMSYELWEPGIVSGEWVLSYPGEINGEAGQAIILMNGLGGTDWAISPSDNGSLRLLQKSNTTWNDGSSMWLFDSELHR
ncbi:hypothetical protein MTP04_33900 [Lysinibacillus sp. PLM2]|nr:hypothetical protein MTP04_33900 [Lysinibacillus sp. PLM2]